MDINLKSNKRYIKCSLVDTPSIFEGYYEDYEVPESVLGKLSKDIGFPISLYNTLHSISKESSDSLVSSMSKQSNHTEIFLLVDDELRTVIGYSLDESRSPILNNEFISRVISLADTSPEISLSEVYYSPLDSISFVILKRIESVSVEEKYLYADSKSVSYDIGVLLVNDESNTSYTRLVVYINGQPLYLPATYYNATTSRYKRSTGSSVESLEVLMLKIIDDLRGKDLFEKIYEFHYRYRANKDVLTSYEEYNTLLRMMRKIPAVIEDDTILSDLYNRQEIFEKQYSKLEDQKSSYIWRCTAIGTLTIGSLIAITSDILNSLSAPSIEYFSVRELLGTYVSTHRIIEEIAKEDKEY